MRSAWFVLMLVAFPVVAAAGMPAAHPGVDRGAAATPAERGVSDSQMTQRGTVLSSVETKGFTYIEVKQDARTLWLAVPTTRVKAGDTVRFPDAPVMPAYHSPSLGRSFANVMFVSRVIVNDGK